MEYPSALKRMGIPTPATAWMNVGDIALSDVSQTQRDKHCMILVPQTPHVITFMETEGRMVVSGGGEVGG